MGDFNVGWLLGKRILSAEACLTPGELAKPIAKLMGDAPCRN
jgi:hypothetical protein